MLHPAIQLRWWCRDGRAAGDPGGHHERPDRDARNERRCGEHGSAGAGDAPEVTRACEREERRSRGEDAIYFATAKNRYVGSVSLGYEPDGKRIRRKVFGRTKQEVREKLKALHQELNAGVRSSSTFTIPK